MIENVLTCKQNVLAVGYKYNTEGILAQIEFDIKRDFLKENTIIPKEQDEINIITKFYNPHYDIFYTIKKIAKDLYKIIEYNGPSSIYNPRGNPSPIDVNELGVNAFGASGGNSPWQKHWTKPFS